MPFMCCGDIGFWQMLGVLPADDSALVETSFSDVGNHHDHSTSFSTDPAMNHSGEAAPADISGMINGLMAMQAARKAGLAYNWNSQHVMDDAATAADKLSSIRSGGLGNPTNFSDSSVPVHPSEWPSTNVSHTHEIFHPTAFAASSSTALPTLSQDMLKNDGAESAHPEYAMQVKHIPIPKSIAPQPAVSMNGDVPQPDSNLPPVDWGHAGKEWTMASHHSRMLANQMTGPEGIKARALQERLDTIQNNQMRDAMDLVRNMDSWMKAKNPYIEKVQELSNLNWAKEA